MLGQQPKDFCVAQAAQHERQRSLPLLRGEGRRHPAQRRQADDGGASTAPDGLGCTAGSVSSFSSFSSSHQPQPASVRMLTNHAPAKSQWDDVFEKAPNVVEAGDVVHAWRSPSIAEAAVAQGLDVVTSHGYYLTAGDGVDTDYAITWEMIYSRDPADLNWNSPHSPPVGPPSPGGSHFLGAEVRMRPLLRLEYAP